MPNSAALPTRSMPDENRIQKNMRLTPVANRILRKAAVTRGQSEGQFVEFLLRQFAANEGWTEFGPLPRPARGRDE